MIIISGKRICMPRRLSSVAAPGRTWKSVELDLFLLFCVLRPFLLFRTWDMSVGFDAGSHLEMLDATHFGQPLPGVFDLFYSYHPPFAFFLARTLTLLGLPSVASVQLISSASTFIAFLAIRDVMRTLKVLEKPGAIAFLYISFSLPLSVFLSHAISLDSMMFCAACVLLALSVRFATQRFNINLQKHRALLLLITGTVFLSLMTKFTGFLLLTLPLCAYGVLVSTFSRKEFSVLCASLFLGVLFAFPYYYIRYFEPGYGFLPNNTNIYDRQDQEFVREWRSTHPTRFFIQTLLPSPLTAQNWHYRDMDQLRLSDTWKDFWVQDQWLLDRNETQELPLAGILSYLYFMLSPLFCFGGLILFLFHGKARDVWTHWGLLLFACSGVFLAALYQFILENPWAGSLSNKGMYIAPVSLLIGYLLSRYYENARLQGAWYVLGFGVLAAFMTANYLLPVY